MTGNKLSKEAKLRMETMVGTNDGFEIAEVDLKLRGPGDLMGTQQSGVLDLKIADISKDSQLVILAREIAVKLIESDPTISDPTNRYIRDEISKIVRSKPNWGKIA
jgi:ATP-dependent DNA helicase RecG